MEAILTVTYSDIETLARSKADMVNSSFLSDAEWLANINASYRELYELVVASFEDYFTTSVTVTVNAGEDGYTSPTAFFKVRGVDKDLGSSDYVSLARFNFAERNRWNNRVYSLRRANFNQMEYKWIGNSIKIIPSEQAPGTYRIWYIPELTVFSSDSDAINVELERWHDYIAIDAAIKAIQKEEGDISALVMQKEQMRTRIQNMAVNRDAGGVERVADTASNFDPENW